MAVELITEVANSHQGSVIILKEIIKKFYKAGAKSIKFQIYFAEDFLTKNHQRYLHFKKQSFTKNEWGEIIKFTKKIGYKNIYADILGLKAFKVAKSLQLDGYKIHSTDLNNDSLLKRISLENKKTFLSVGGAKLFEINHALSYFKGNTNKPILMHGFQSYPTKVEDTNLNRLNFLKRNYGENCEYGYQDHIAGNSKYSLYMSLVSIGYGIKYLERHVTINRKKKGIDYYSSIEPNEFKKLNKILISTNKGIENNKNLVSESENFYRKSTKKFWITKRDIKKNSIIKPSDVEFKRINNQSQEPLMLNEIVKKKINKNLSKGSVLSNKLFNKKIYAIIVARYASKRLPGKAAIKIENLSLLEILIRRIKRSKIVDKIIFCTTRDRSDNVLCKIANKNNITVYRGLRENVLGRMLAATKKNSPDIIIRITGDDILIDTDYMDKAVEYHLENNLDYTDHKNLPSGTETEIFNRNIMEFINENAEDTSGTEYLTYYIKKNEIYFRTGSAPVKKIHNKRIRLTIDNEKDLKFVRPFLKKMVLIKKIDTFSIDDIFKFYGSRTNYQKQSKDKLNINTNIKIH